MKSRYKIPMIILLGFILWLIMYITYRGYSLHKNFAVTDGYIYKFGRASSSGKLSSHTGTYFKYRFKVNNDDYTGETSIPCSWNNSIKFPSWDLGKKMQLVYDRKNPNNSKMLFCEKDYKEFDLSVPEEFQDELHYLDSLCY